MTEEKSDQFDVFRIAIQSCCNCSTDEMNWRKYADGYVRVNKLIREEGYEFLNDMGPEDTVSSSVLVFCEQGEYRSGCCAPCVPINS